jgi:hypothetical protein
MLDAFYGAFSPACFALLGLWLVVVQIRIDDWRGDENRKRMAYVVALNFLLPGLMGVLALVNSQDSAFWRTSFAALGIGGAVCSYLVVIGSPRARRTPSEEPLEAAAYWATIALYVIITVLAFFGGLALLRAEAVLLTVLIFVNFNLGWLLLFASAKEPQTSGT